MKIKWVNACEELRKVFGGIDKVLNKCKLLLFLKNNVVISIL